MSDSLSSFLEEHIPNPCAAVAQAAKSLLYRSAVAEHYSCPCSVAILLRRGAGRVLSAAPAPKLPWSDTDAGSRGGRRSISRPIGRILSRHLLTRNRLA